MPARVTRGALVAHRHSFANPRCRTSQYRRTFVPISVSLWNDLSDPVFDGMLSFPQGFYWEGRRIWEIARQFWGVKKIDENKSKSVFNVVGFTFTLFFVTRIQILNF